MINLDCITKENLHILYLECDSHIRLMAKKYGYTIKDMNHIKNYAINKFVAMKLREEGNISTSLVYEDICEKIYNRLSKSARW